MHYVATERVMHLSWNQAKWPILDLRILKLTLGLSQTRRKEFFEIHWKRRIFSYSWKWQFFTFFSNLLSKNSQNALGFPMHRIGRLQNHTKCSFLRGNQLVKRLSLPTRCIGNPSGFCEFLLCNFEKKLKKAQKLPFSAIWKNPEFSMDFKNFFSPSLGKTQSLF